MYASLEVQELRVYASKKKKEKFRGSTAGYAGSIPGRGTKILHAMWHSQNKKIKIIWGGSLLSTQLSCSFSRTDLLPSLIDGAVSFTHDRTHSVSSLSGINHIQAKDSGGIDLNIGAGVGARVRSHRSCLRNSKNYQLPQENTHM